MSRSKSSQRWLREHFTDNYFYQAKKTGYRSRASFKLLAMDKKYNLLRSGMQIIDLGASPGGWSQVATQKIGKQGKVISVDLLPIEKIAGVATIEGDFTDENIVENIFFILNNNHVDLVMSDMAPNMSGIRLIDQEASMNLAWLALNFACKVIISGGNFLVKAFHGEKFDDLVKEMCKYFAKVSIEKPEASRLRSREVYIVGQGYRKA